MNKHKRPSFEEMVSWVDSGEHLLTLDKDEDEEGEDVENDAD